MPRHHQALSDDQRRAFSALIRAGREDAGLSLYTAADETIKILVDWDHVDLSFSVEDHVRWLESAPATPLANPHRLAASLKAYGLTWRQVLEVIGVDREVLDVPQV